MLNNKSTEQIRNSNNHIPDSDFRLVLKEIKFDIYNQDWCIITCNLINNSQSAVQLNPRSLRWALTSGLRFWLVDTDCLFYINPSYPKGFKLTRPPSDITIKAGDSYEFSDSIQIAHRGFILTYPSRSKQEEQKIKRIKSGKYAMDVSLEFSVRIPNSQKKQYFQIESCNKQWLTIPTEAGQISRTNLTDTYFLHIIFSSTSSFFSAVPLHMYLFF
jgi:hypothetical protein